MPRPFLSDDLSKVRPHAASRRRRKRPRPSAAETIFRASFILSPISRAASFQRLGLPYVQNPSRSPKPATIRQHVGALLCLGPARSDHDRDLGDAELPGGEHASMARNQATVLAHQGRRRPPPLPDARGYRGHLGVRVGAGVSGVRDQPINRPRPCRPATVFDYRPRLARGRARAAREGNR